MSSFLITVEPIHKTEASILNKGSIVLIFIFVLAFVPRILSLDAFMMADEQFWIKRSVNFLKAIISQDFAGTHITGHPGVITMWLGSTPIVFAKKILGYSALRELLFSARLPFVLTTVVTIVATCAILLRMYNWKLALLAGTLLASDPFFTAYSRIIHLDAILTCAMTLSVLLCIYFLRNVEKKKYLIMSGVFGGLAMLAKVPGVFLIVFIATIFFLHLIWQDKRAVSSTAYLKNRFKDYGVWLLTAAVVVFLLWPAMWVDPLTYVKVLLKGPGMVAHEAGQFLLGNPIDDPGFIFYPLLILFRTTPVTLLSAGVYLVFIFFCLIRNPSGYRKIDFEALVLIIFTIGFTIFMSIPAKKLERYVLPVFPAIDILAAMGLYRFFEMIRRKRPSRISGRIVNGLLAGVLIVQLLPIYVSFPYYSTYYNPLAGGARTAEKAILIGNGEGLDLVADYLNKKENADELKVASDFSYLLSVFFNGKVRPTSINQYKPGTLDEVDYLVVYVSGLQKQNRKPDEVLRYVSKHEPEKIISIGGIVYASIYNLKPR